MSSERLFNNPLTFLYDCLVETSDLFFPSHCASCGAYGDSLQSSRTLCGRCDILLRQSLLNIHRPNVRYASFPIVSAGRYEYELARCILAFKGAQRTDLLPYFSVALARTVNQLLLESIHVPLSQLYLVAVPSDAASIHQRGFSPAELLARSASDHITNNVPSHFFASQQSRPVKSVPAVRKRSTLLSKMARSGGQKQLGVSARYTRLKNSLKLSGPPMAFLGFEYNLVHKPCLIIDDVVTTGASIQATAEILKAAGADVLGACTLAAVPKRNIT